MFRFLVFVLFLVCSFSRNKGSNPMPPMPLMNHSLRETKSQNDFRPLRPFPSEDEKLIFHPTNPTIPTASSAESELKIHPTNPTTSSTTSNFLFFHPFNPSPFHSPKSQKFIPPMPHSAFLHIPQNPHFSSVQAYIIKVKKPSGACSSSLDFSKSREVDFHI